MEEFDLTGITMETLHHVFPLHHAHPPLASPAPAQGPPSPPTPDTPKMTDSPGEVHMVVDLPDTLKIMVLSPDDESIEGLEGHLEDEDDREEDHEINEVVGGSRLTRRSMR